MAKIETRDARLPYQSLLIQIYVQVLLFQRIENGNTDVFVSVLERFLQFLEEPDQLTSFVVDHAGQSGVLNREKGFSELAEAERYEKM